MTSHVAKPQEDTNRIYECAVLYPYPFAQKDEQMLLKEIESMFADAGGVQVSKDNWGRRGLAYKIGGFMEGNYIIYHYEIDPSKVKELDRALRITKGVLRHLILALPNGYPIVKYSERYQEWKKESDQAEDKRLREREEKLQRQVAEKAKRQVKRADERKKDASSEKPETPPKDINAELEKLISNDSLNI